MKGPIRPGPTEVVVCTPCTHIFSTRENPIRVGVVKRHAAVHLQNHRLGLIRRPTEAK